MRAAKYLGVAPWDLIDRPIWWMHRALLFEAAENEAQAELNRRASGE